jgi:hypothetical protein
VSGGREQRQSALEKKARTRGLSPDEATELADLHRGGPPPVLSKLLVREPPVRPWTASFWRGRGVGPLGALLILAGLLIVLIAVFAQRPAIDWRIYEDAAFTFALDYPQGWTSAPLSDRSKAKEGEKPRRIDAVVFAPSQDTPSDLGGVFDPGYRGPAYGVAVYQPGPAALPFIVPGGAGVPTEARIGGLDGEEIIGTFEGVTTRIAYATDEEGRLVVFFARAPEERVDDFREIFDHARSSVSVSGGIEATASPPRATPRG